MTAFIFDLNGVIVDDERIHQESWRRICRKHGIQLSEEEFKNKVFGRTEKETFNYLFKKTLTDTELKPLLEERVNLAIELYKPNIALTEYLSEFLEGRKQQKIPMAIATSARWKYTNFVLDALELRSYFSAIVTAEDVQKGKPDPEVYLKAAKLLDILPTNCVAIEDSVSGITSAKRAGMYVFGITTTHKRDELGLADHVIDSFNEIQLPLAKKLKI